MRSYSQLIEFDLLLDFDLDLRPRHFKNELLPNLNVATNLLNFHHSTTKTVVRKLFTNKQTNKEVKTIPPKFTGRGNYGNLAYLVATTYGINVIKIGRDLNFPGGQKPISFEAPRGGAYNNRKHLKLWEPGLFNG